MRYNIISLRDIVANHFHPPMFVPTLGAAIRSFGDACQNTAGDNDISRHPEHFELYHIGYWEDGQATFTIKGNETEDDEGQDITFAIRQIATGANYKR